MPASNPTLTTFAGTAPPWSLAALDTNLSNIAAILKSINTYEQYVVDTGAANVYVAAYAAGTTFTLSAGVGVTFKAANANTGASTLAAGGTAAKNILNIDGTALLPNQILAGGIYHVVYDGTQYLLLGMAAGTGTTSTTFTFDGGGATTGAITLTWQRIGKFVTMNVPAVLAVTGAGSTVLTSNTAVGTAARPSSATQYGNVPAILNNAALVAPQGSIGISTGGILTILRDAASTAFTNGANAGSNNSFVFSYIIA